MGPNGRQSSGQDACSDEGTSPDRTNLVDRSHGVKIKQAKETANALINAIFPFAATVYTKYVPVSLYRCGTKDLELAHTSSNVTKTAEIYIYELPISMAFIFDAEVHFLLDGDQYQHDTRSCRETVVSTT
jgi:hypothetical protein